MKTALRLLLAKNCTMRRSSLKARVRSTWQRVHYRAVLCDKGEATPAGAVPCATVYRCFWPTEFDEMSEPSNVRSDRLFSSVILVHAARGPASAPLRRALHIFTVSVWYFAPSQSYTVCRLSPLTQTTHAADLPFVHSRVVLYGK